MLVRCLLVGFGAVLAAMTGLLGAIGLLIGSSMPAILGASSQAQSVSASYDATLSCGATGTGATLAAAAARAAGWPAEHLEQVVAIAGAESGFDPREGNRLADGRTHRGLMQVSSLHLADTAVNPVAPADQRYDPVVNMTMALRLWQRAGGDSAAFSGPWRASRAHWGDHAVAARSAVAEGGAAQVCDASPADALADLPVHANCAVSVGQTVEVPGGSTRVCAVAPGVVVDTRLAPYVARLFAQARAAGHDLAGSSGWRSHERQKQLRAQNCDADGCSPPTAVPGTSQHEYALAVDLVCDGELIRSRASACYRFVESTVARLELPLANLPTEAWHWSTSGR